ncbi:malate Na(+) symporter [Halalkalibacter wakoensis JCM 9140]|uniref:Malate Na(+) symporter n=1 Tax=Halalkalibacter wakoensis JCM 9140 TaxID=1236970 RepID=W4Q4C3_9BACI|nr:2-hydroxycarboxylate transporter family protein [Halalkalibacter wakoensis]GAE26810.1 malate Na(+) symporter [Halalkalibacter wakoensis JCM 9140]
MGQSEQTARKLEESIEEKDVIYKLNQKKEIKILGLPIFWFMTFLTLTIVTVYTGNLPAGMIGSLLVMVVFGEALGWIGDRLPIVKSYLGGGAIVAIFGSAYMVYSGILPETVATSVSDFMTTGGFLDFYIAALITGSILGMNSKVLMKIGVRYFVPIFGAVIGAMLIAVIVAFFIGFSLQEAVLVITLPILGGGMGAGAIPMAQVYSEFLGNPPSYYISILVPALALGNVFAIVFASLLNSLGKKVPSLTGNGQLIPGFKMEEQKSKFDISKMGIGLLAALLFFACGHLLGAIIPLHPYALMIILVAIAKIANVIPANVVEGASQWYQFVAKTWTLALLFGIGVAFTDLNAVLAALSVQYILLVAGVVCGAVLGAALFGKIVGFYPIESAISAGLCMANMGGTGDVAVLSASKRMQLMPFAQIASRLGGALILLLAGLLMPFFL